MMRLHLDSKKKQRLFDSFSSLSEEERGGQCLGKKHMLYRTKH